MVVADKNNKTFKIIEFAITGYVRIEDKDKEKIEKCEDLPFKVAENLKRESSDYIFTCFLIWCYDQTVQESTKQHYNSKKIVAEDRFIRYD